MDLLQRLRGDMETQRLRLRRWKQRDFKEYISFMSDPEVMIPAGARVLDTLDKAMPVFHHDIRDDGCFAMERKDAGEVIGRIKFQTDMRRYDVPSLSVGYELRRDCWGNGYMQEALCAMILRAFEKEKVDVIGISHDSENHRSRRVIEKCGFQYEGTVHHARRRADGKIVDDLYYYLLREDFPAWKTKFFSAVS
ncbi:MAG: GNAT family N-acetyltransferase [Acutalibacter sp.]|nr:GNAT family N-acetyltransferase [Acutalibacter sp.]